MHAGTRGAQCAPPTRYPGHPYVGPAALGGVNGTPSHPIGATLVVARFYASTLSLLALRFTSSTVCNKSYLSFYL